MFAHESDIKTACLVVRFSMRLAAEFQATCPYPAPIAFPSGNEETALREWEGLPPTPTSTSPSPNRTWKDVTDAEIDDYMFRVAHTALRFSSTCPMGVDEKTGVVDQRLKVFGFKNLRIADASILPVVTSAHTMTPVMMVAERCVEFVLEDGKNEKRNEGA